MPAVGDQHRQGPRISATSASATANPFDDAQRISEYTASEIATLQNRLNKQLGPEYLSTRQGPGGQRVHYISADKCINLANEVFGFNGWSSSIQNVQVDFVDEDPNSGKISLGLSVIVRVTLRDGTYHEDIGYGHIENCRGKAAAFEKAKKEGTTDGLKRALRTFGKVLGNCIYDKEYLSRVTKVKAIPTKWDVGNLHRHSDFAPIKQEQPAPPVADAGKQVAGPSASHQRAPTEKGALAEFEGEFGSDLFDEADFSEQHTFHPDEVALDQHPQPQNFSNSGYQGPQRIQNSATASAPVHLETPSKPQRTGPSPGEQPTSLPSHGNRVTRLSLPAGKQFSTPHSKPPISAPSRPQILPQTSSIVTQHPNPPNTPNLAGQPVVKPELNLANKENAPETKVQSSQSSQATEKIPEELPMGFFSARAAEALKTDPQSAVKNAPAFDPRFESPSIRKTAGFNHNMSAPVARNTYQILPPQLHKATTSNSSFIPSSSQAGRVGALGPMNATAFSSPLPKPPLTTSYRPPMRRSMAANNNTNASTSTVAAQGTTNANGKRPPLSDTTNVTPGSGDEKRSNTDGAKRNRISEPEGKQVPLNQQGPQVSR